MLGREGGFCGWKEGMRKMKELKSVERRNGAKERNGSKERGESQVEKEERREVGCMECNERRIVGEDNKNGKGGLLGGRSEAGKEGRPRVKMLEGWKDG